MSYLLRLLAFLIVALASPMALAQTLDQAKVDEVIMAKDTLVALAKDVYRSGNPPRQSDPAVDAMLAKALDLDFLPHDTTMQFSERGKLGRISNSVIAVGNLYVFAGIGSPDSPNIDLEKVDANTVKFAPEMGRFIDGNLRISEALVRCIVSAMEADPKGFEQVIPADRMQTFRAGMIQSVTGVLQTLAIDGLSHEWRRQRITVLLHFAPWIAKLAPPEDVKSLRDLVARTAAMKPAVTDDLMKVYLALKKT